MKVIKDGTKNMQTTCYQCNSILEYEQEDITYQTKETYSTVINERWVGFFKKQYYSTLYKETIGSITCPICNHKIKVKGKMEEIGEKIFSKKELEWY